MLSESLTSWRKKTFEGMETGSQCPLPIYHLKLSCAIWDLPLLNNFQKLPHWFQNSCSPSSAWLLSPQGVKTFLNPFFFQPPSGRLTKSCLPFCLYTLTTLLPTDTLSGSKIQMQSLRSQSWGPSSPPWGLLAPPALSVHRFLIITPSRIWTSSDKI